MPVAKFKKDEFEDVPADRGLAYSIGKGVRDIAKEKIIPAAGMAMDVTTMPSRTAANIVTNIGRGLRGVPQESEFEPFPLYSKAAGLSPLTTLEQEQQAAAQVPGPPATQVGAAQMTPEAMQPAGAAGLMPPPEPVQAVSPPTPAPAPTGVGGLRSAATERLTSLLAAPSAPADQGVGRGLGGTKAATSIPQLESEIAQLTARADEWKPPIDIYASDVRKGLGIGEAPTIKNPEVSYYIGPTTLVTEQYRPGGDISTMIHKGAAPPAGGHSEEDKNLWEARYNALEAQANPLEEERNRLRRRVARMRTEEKLAGLSETEKILARYPNPFTTMYDDGTFAISGGGTASPAQMELWKARVGLGQQIAEEKGTAAGTRQKEMQTALLPVAAATTMAEQERVPDQKSRYIKTAVEVPSGQTAGFDGQPVMIKKDMIYDTQSRQFIDPLDIQESAMTELQGIYGGLSTRNRSLVEKYFDENPEATDEDVLNYARGLK